MFLFYCYCRYYSCYYWWWCSYYCYVAVKVIDDRIIIFKYVVIEYFVIIEGLGVESVGYRNGESADATTSHLQGDTHLLPYLTLPSYHLSLFLSPLFPIRCLFSYLPSPFSSLLPILSFLPSRFTLLFLLPVPYLPSVGRRASGNYCIAACRVKTVA